MEVEDDGDFGVGEIIHTKPPATRLAIIPSLHLRIALLLPELAVSRERSSHLISTQDRPTSLPNNERMQAPARVALFFPTRS